MRQNTAEKWALVKDSRDIFVEFQPASERPDACYARELRAVGQALEGQQFISLDLEIEGDSYVVHGRASVPKNAQTSFLSFVGDLVVSVLRGNSRPRKSAGEVEYRYSPAQVQDIDVRGRGKREAADKMPDPYSLSQILRGAGTYLDKREKASLVGISIEGQWVTVRYKAADGRIEQLKQDLEYFYDYWVKAYLRRSNRKRLPPPSTPTIFVTWGATRAR